MYISYIPYIFVEKISVMEAIAKTTKRKVIDIPEDVFRYLSIKAVASGTNLKKYIESLLAENVADMDDATTYKYLSDTKPGGHIMVSEKEKNEFEEWLGLNKK